MPRTVKSDANLAPGNPAKPLNLSEPASAEWDRLIADLENAHIQVTTAHRPLITLAATIAADIRKAWAIVKKDGEYITNKKTGDVQVHPASKRLDALRRDYIKVLVTLGTRATAAPPPDDSRARLENLLKG